MIGSGIFLLVQRQVGPRASATVADCVTSGAGRYMSVHCTGSWVVGGSLLDGGHVVVGTIDGADTGDIGKTIDVTLRGDTAYSRGLNLPLLLIGLGLVPAVGSWGAQSFARARLGAPSREAEGMDRGLTRESRSQLSLRLLEVVLNASFRHRGLCAGVHDRTLRRGRCQAAPRRQRQVRQMQDDSSNAIKKCRDAKANSCASARARRFCSAFAARLSIPVASSVHRGRALRSKTTLG